MTGVTHKTARFRDALTSHLTHADLKDHGGHAVVKMRWDMNPEATRDQIFALTINGQTAYIDLEELMSYTRLM